MSSGLPEDLWRRILEIGVESVGLSYRDLCSLSISCSRLRRLSDDDALWSLLLSSDFNPPPPLNRSTSSGMSLQVPLFLSCFCCCLFGLCDGLFRFEKERQKKIAEHRRAVLRKDSQLAEHSRKIRDLEARLSQESGRARATIFELSNLTLVRQASVALNVWQPEVVRGRHIQMVEQSVVPVESRVRALEMELRLCRQQILGFEAAYKNEKRRLDTAKEQLNSMKYHPLRPNTLMSSATDERETNIKAKRLKRCSQDKGKKS